MTKAERFFGELLDDKFAEMEQKGISQGIANVIKRMMQKNMKDAEIMDITNISNKELEKIKKEIISIIVK